MSMWKDVLAKIAGVVTLIGTPADTDVSTDIANVKTAVDSITSSDATLAKQNTIIADIATAQADLTTKGVAFILVFPIYNSSGGLITAATALDSEISKDGAAFSDCTNEATAIGATGFYTLSLTATEMNADYIAITVSTTSSGAVNPIIIIYTV